MIRRTRVAAVLGLLVACGLANPVAKRPDGTPPTLRTRIGIAAARFVGDCASPHTDCSVQLSMGHAGTRVLRAQIVAVRLIVDGVDIGGVPVSDVRRWRAGAYRMWDHTVWPFRANKLSIALGPIPWEPLLAGHGVEDYEQAIHVEIDLAIDGEAVVVRSMFAVHREPERAFMVT